MFIEQLGKVFRGSLAGGSKGKKAELKAVKYYKKHYKKYNKFPLFTQVLLETRNDCNRKCSFCPQAFQQRPFKEMKWEVFERIIQNLVNIEFSGRIAFNITNEPLLDKRMVEMITYARKVSPRFFLDITTNGHLLDIELADTFFAAGLDNLNINDYRSDREMKKHRYKLSGKLETVSRAYASNPKLVFSYRRTNEILTNWAGVVEKHTKNTHLNSFCNYPFRKIAVSPDGDVVLCCMDYRYEVKFGNVMEKPLEEIWYAQGLDEYRFMLLERKREKMLCAKCDGYQY